MQIQMNRNRDENRKLFSKCMKMKTDSKYRADARRHGDENRKIQNTEQMHGDMEMKTENCFLNEKNGQLWVRFIMFFFKQHRLPTLEGTWQGLPTLEGGW